MEQTTPTSTLFALYVAFFIAIVSFTLPLMAGVYIVGQLGGSNEISAYNITFFGLGNAIGIPLGKILPERMGASKTICCSLLLFVLVSLCCAHAWNYPIYIFMRFLQGLILGPLFITITPLFKALVKEEKQDMMTSINITLFTFVPTLGACWGGWLAYEYHWKYILHINLPLIIFLSWFIYHRLKDIKIPVEKNVFDWVGYIFFVITVIALGSALSMGQELDWFRSNLIIALVLIGTVTLIFFLGWNRYHPDPIIQLSLLKRPLFCFGIINIFILFSTYYGILILLSLWLHLYANYTPLWISLILGIMLIGGFLPALLIHKKMSHVDARIPLLIALVLLAISSFYTATFSVEVDIKHLAISRVLAGLSFIFFLPEVFKICFHVIPEEKSIEVINVLQISRVLASSIGISFYTILWQRRQVFYHDRLGEELTSFSQLTDGFFGKASEVNLNGMPALAKLEYYLQRQATSLALDDCFYLMGWLVVGLIFLMLFTLFIRQKADGIESRVIKFFLLKDQ